MQNMNDMNDMNDMVSEIVGTRSAKMKLYYSDREDSYITNAKTGEKYPWKVGSKDEERLFKVKNTSMDARFHQGRGSLTAYYDSPQQYMKLNNVDLPEEIIKKWENRVENF